MAVGIGVIGEARARITAPGWNEGGSIWPDLRPDVARFVGQVVRAKLRKKMRRGLGLSGGGGLPAFVIEETVLAGLLRVTEADVTRITEDDIERETE